MKYIPLLMLWLVILAGTWTDLSQEFFSPTGDLREISKAHEAKAVSRDPNNVKTSNNPNLIKARELLEKGDMKEAILEYEAGLSNKAWANSNPKIWVANLRTLIGVIDPNLTYEFLSSFLGQGSVPNNLKESAGVWRLHAREWANSAAAQSPEQSISDVKNLLERAESLKAKYPGRPDSLVLYLRSSAQMNSVLQSDSKNQEALLLAARAAEGLEDRQAVAFFYEKCVVADPNSRLGQICLRRQQSSSSLTANHPIEETGD